MAKIVKATPRREREWPTVYSTNTPEWTKMLTEAEEKCYVSNSQYRKLQRYYYKLFKKYQRLEESYMKLLEHEKDVAFEYAESKL